MAQNKYNEEYYKVSFVTTHSPNIPNMLKYTGGLIVMSDLSSKDPTTGKNRMSIWLRGESIASGFGFSSTYLMNNSTWWANAYNRIFGPNGAEAFDPESEYNKGNGQDIPAYTSYGTPISISNKIDFVYSYLNEVNSTLSSKISYNSSYTNIVINDINNKIDNAKKEHDRDINNIGTYLTSYKLDSYNYTNYRIERLVGGAPDFLDTLGEISYWLQNAQQLGISTVSEIMNIKNSYVTHDEADANGYTYISTYTYKSVRNEKPEIGYVYSYTWTDNGDGSYTKEWTKTDKTYEFYEYNNVKDGTLAVHPEQVSTPFSGHNLSDILQRIITPYPYAYPSVVPNTIDNIKYDKWVEVPVPVGSTVNADAAFIVNNNDAIETTKCTIQDTEAKIADNTVTLKISKDNIQLGKNVIVTSYSVTHSDAEVKEYPQLKGMDPKVYDEEHAFKAQTSSGTLTDYIYKIGKYECYVGQDVDVDNMNTFASDYTNKLTASSFFIDGNNNTGAGISNVLNEDKTSVLVWLLVPTLLLSDKYRIYIIDENTKVEQCIYHDGISEYASDIVSVEKKELEGTFYGMSFTKISMKSSRYPFSNSFRFKIDY